MKTKLRQSISVILSLCMIISMFSISQLNVGAAYKTEDGFSYTILGNGTAEITDYSGKAENLVIPSVINGYTVTSIGEQAFFSCTNLSSVTISDSVKSIGTSAFGYCTKLTSVIIGNGGGNISIGTSAFGDCSKLTSVILSNSVTSIGNRAFEYCMSLKSVAIPESVKTIGSYAFGYYYAYDIGYCRINGFVIYGYEGSSAERYAAEYDITFESIFNMPTIEPTTAESTEKPTEAPTIAPSTAPEEPEETTIAPSTAPEEPEETTIAPATSPEIGRVTDNGFSYKLFEDGTAEVASYRGTAKNLVIPSVINGYTVTSIGESAFAYNTSFSSVDIPYSITRIGKGAFFACMALSSVTIPDSVTSIETIAFEFCGLKSVTIGNGNGNISIGTDAFSECSSITSVIISNSVTSIGKGAFSFCTRLPSVTIPESVKTIGNSAFACCTEMKSAIISGNAGSIGSYAFGYYFSYGDEEMNPIKEFVIYGFKGSSAEHYAAEYDMIFETISEMPTNPDESEETIIAPEVSPEETHVTDDGYNYEILGDGTTEITGYRGTATNLDIPSNIDGYTVTSIGEWAFSGRTNITSVTIPGSVTSIGERAFYNCTGLASIDLPDSVTNIGYKSCFNTAYYNDDSNWEAGVLYINKYLIDTKIDTLSGDCTVKNDTLCIADQAFEYCYNLVSVTISDSIISVGNRAFQYCTKLESIDVPESVAAIGLSAFYETAYYNDDSNWEAGVLYIGNYLIKAKTALSGDYTIKNGTMYIAEQAFGGCKNLESVDIPDSVTSIENWAFRDCINLKKVTIGNGVTKIGENAFCRCVSLTNITIPDSVTSIRDFAFSGCISLASVTIGNSVTSIEDYAFYNCKSLISVTIPNNVKKIGAYVFYECTGMKSVTVPKNVSSIGSYAFGYYYNDEYGLCPVDEFVIFGYEGSSAERYADDNGITFISLNNPPTTYPGENTVMTGDMNGDGIVDAKDRIILTRYLAKWAGYENQINLDAADVNRDGVVDAKDRITLTRYLAKWKGYETLSFTSM